MSEKRDNGVNKSVINWFPRAYGKDIKRNKK